MNNYQRDIILVINDKAIHPGSADHALQWMNDIIACADNVDGFCNAHELVNRNRIISKKSKILEAVNEGRLKPFRFLINKN